MELKLTVFKDGAYKFKAIFVWFTEYAEKQILTSVWVVTTHFSKIINQQYLQKALKYKAMYGVLCQIEA